MSDKKVKPLIYEFARDAILLCKKVESTQKEYDMTRQLRRSATSINANYAEAEFAASERDFANKLNIALKEANESKQWINLLHDTEYINDCEFAPLDEKISSIINMLNSSVLTIKKRLNKS